MHITFKDVGYNGTRSGTNHREGELPQDQGLRCPLHRLVGVGLAEPEGARGTGGSLRSLV